MNPICTSLEEALKIASGETNAEARHLVVPLYMPLAKPLALDQALRGVSPELRDHVQNGEAELVAVASGTMMLDGDKKKLQLVLFRMEGLYHTFETFSDEVETAVLMDGDGRRYSKSDPLPREEAVRQWMAGFLNWNCEVPGMYQLRYAMIEPR